MISTSAILLSSHHLLSFYFVSLDCNNFSTISRSYFIISIFPYLCIPSNPACILWSMIEITPSVTISNRGLEYHCNQWDLTDTYRTLYLTATEYTFCSSVHGTFPSTDHMFGHKQVFNKFFN